jgi:hypothetical protein
MSADNENLLEIINSVANDLTGANAQTSGVNPNKASLVERVNDVQKDICNSKDWTFMITTAEVNAFDVTTTTAVATSGVYMSENSAFMTSASPNKTEYFAQSFTSDTTYLMKPISFVFSLEVAGLGIGAPSGTLSLTICPDKSGTPDIDNPVITADAMTPSWGDYATQKVTNYFYFIANTAVLAKGTKYWYVLKWIGAADNGDSFYINYDPYTSPSTTTYSRLNNATTWTAFTAGMMSVTFNYYQADYKSTLTLGTGVQKVLRLYTGTHNTPTYNLLPYSTTNYINKPSEVPTGYFVVKTMTSGALEVWINPSVENPSTTWTVEYKKRATPLSADADYSDIPQDFRALLKKGALLYYMSIGLGMQDTGAIALVQAEYEKMLKDMRTIYLPNPIVKMGVSRRGSTPSTSPYLNRGLNSWSVK